VDQVAAAAPKEKFRERDPPQSKDMDLPALEVLVAGEEKAKVKVLLVEDNMVNQRLGSRLLGKLGYEVITANDGSQAVEHVQHHTFFVCLMDCQMPILDGFAATRRIRDLERAGTLYGHLPIIALTANVSTESEDQCRIAGMDHFLPKPLKLDDLNVALQQYGRTFQQPGLSTPPH